MPGAIAGALHDVAGSLGWTDSARGIFGKVVPEGSKVVVKPNFVLHANQGGDPGGDLPLITHPSIVAAVVAEALKANPSQVIVGDAPIQSCDFNALLRSTGLQEWSDELRSIDGRFLGIRDFRRTTSTSYGGIRIAAEDVRSEANYVRFNLGQDSLLEPLTTPEAAFRVTSYDPRLMAKTHSPGNHQYLVAKEVIEADVVINLPKLKTHTKAGITNALKNLVGINGNKEFLPHHRVGGSADGGDCYPGRSFLKRTLETVFDHRNTTGSYLKGRALAAISDQLERAVRLSGDEVGVEGSWSGNETVARMTLDLNRILLYGRTDASMAETVQRRVIHIVDAVVAGQGDGPLSPESLPLGLIMAAENALAADTIGAKILRYDTSKISLLTLALGHFRWPIADFQMEDIRVRMGGR